MDSLSTVLNLVKQGDWGISLDLKDAYVHVPIYKTHKIYLRFCLKNGRALQFKALPFGPTSSPRVFYKNCGSSCCSLKVKGHKTGCLSRRLVPSESGKKSNNIRSRISTQSPCRTRIHNKLKKVHFGSITTDNILRGNVSLGSGDRFANSGKNVQNQNQNSQRFSSPSRDNVILLRNNSQCKITHETCSNTSVEILETSFSEVKVQLLQSNKPSKMVVRSNQHKQGRSWETHATMTTDASTSVGWGGHMGTQIAQGTWNLSRKNFHINCLDMEAVIRTIKHILSQLR
ncbi:Hypothetical predicted protein [Mytilus galloprovincialis]|uniref:Reverse transcriptase domain-containing protein n=1 Tax=Mytilus galloprovincialis TaxID=29158 RepID=A0A8B6EDT5_MYTGA|nr:Hypothetical predicted protein [Mytilus galloprovincialis]